MIITDYQSITIIIICITLIILLICVFGITMNSKSQKIKLLKEQNKLIQNEIKSIKAQNIMLKNQLEMLKK